MRTLRTHIHCCTHTCKHGTAQMVRHSPSLSVQGLCAPSLWPYHAQLKSESMRSRFNFKRKQSTRRAQLLQTCHGVQHSRSQPQSSSMICWCCCNSLKRLQLSGGAPTRQADARIAQAPSPCCTHTLLSAGMRTSSRAHQHFSWLSRRRMSACC